jgi:hypothetical protein
MRALVNAIDRVSRYNTDGGSDYDDPDYELPVL